MTASESKSQVETDLDRARERLSFYEQFDEIIKQNIASSSALLKEASARFDSDFAEERDRYRTLLSEILDDVTLLQAQSERLARRVNDALDELETNLPAAAEAVASVAPGIVAEAPPEAAAVIGSAATGTRKRPDRAKPAPAEPAPPARTVPDSPVLPKVAPVAELPPSGPASTTLLVHGVPRASAALGLKSYIEQLDFVSAVEPREFAAGLLRLQVDGSRPLTLGDLSGWNMAARIELKNTGADLLELGLAPA
ncbi:MAG TPA: hypothetical protein VFP05_18570 [Thermomicrobiales bacterium]|nr:hypothetical protein [Thermomicrobiales bacterium]